MIECNSDGSRSRSDHDRRAPFSVLHCRIHLPIVSDAFRRFLFITSHCNVDKRSFSESGGG